MTLLFETWKNSLAVPGPEMNRKLEVNILSLEKKARVKGCGDLQTG